MKFVFVKAHNFPHMQYNKIIVSSNMNCQSITSQKKVFHSIAKFKF